MRIVVGIDGSASSRLAIELVSRLSLPSIARIRLVAAYEAPTAWAPLAPTGGFDTDLLDGARRELFAMLDDLSGPLRQRGLAVESSVERGRAAGVLLDTARELNADLIVVGNRGHGAAASALLGSVSAELVDHAPCPVLVARGAEVTRVLFATDGSESARAIPEVLARWGLFRGMPADVLSIAPARTDFVGLVTPWAVSGDRSVHEHGDLERHRRFADEAASELAAVAGWDATPTVRVGDAAHEIEAAARDWGDDLIVTGACGHGGIERFVLGSVAHHVLLHSRSSVLVMRGHVPARVPRGRTAMVVGAVIA